MQYKYLRDQNKSYQNQVEDQNKIIKDQRILIDKLTIKNIDLLSKLEVKNIKKNQFTIRVYDELDYIIDEDNSNIYNKINNRAKPFNINKIQDNITGIAALLGANIAQASYEFYHAGFKNTKDTQELKYLFYDDIEKDTPWMMVNKSSILNEILFPEQEKTGLRKPKDWYQKHNTKKKDFMLYNIVKGK